MRKFGMRQKFGYQQVFCSTQKVYRKWLNLSPNLKNRKILQNGNREVEWEAENCPIGHSRLITSKNWKKIGLPHDLRIAEVKSEEDLLQNRQSSSQENSLLSRAKSFVKHSHLDNDLILGYEMPSTQTTFHPFQFSAEVFIAAKLHPSMNPYTVCWCQFHQRFYLWIFRTNVIIAAFSSYVLVWQKIRTENARIKHWWNWRLRL